MGLWVKGMAEFVLAGVQGSDVRVAVDVQSSVDGGGSWAVHSNLTERAAGFVSGVGPCPRQ